MFNCIDLLKLQRSILLGMLLTACFTTVLWYVGVSKTVPA